MRAVRALVRAGGCTDCSIAKTVAPTLRWQVPHRLSAAITEIQKQNGSLSNSSSETQATWRECLLTQELSSVVFPQPAAAERRVRGRTNTVSKSWSNRSRTTSAFGGRGEENLVMSNVTPCSFGRELLGDVSRCVAFTAFVLCRGVREGGSDMFSDDSSLLSAFAASSKR